MPAFFRLALLGAKRETQLEEFLLPVSKSRVCDWFPELSGALHEGPALVSPHSETGKAEILEIPRNRKEGQG